MTDKEAKIVVATATAIAEAIREAGPRGVPSGHLYAAVMSTVSLDAYRGAVAALIKAGLVKDEGYLLTWIGD